MTSFTGKCLCGAVSYSCAGEPIMMGFCHCEDCRRSSGAGHCGHIAMPENAVTIQGATTAYSSKADSGNLITRNFCPTCGSAISSTNSGMPGVFFLRASSLNDLEAFQPQMHVYASRAASWDRRDDGLPHFDVMPPGM